MAKTPAPIVHLREIFWRPDILAIAQTEGRAEVSMCDQVLPAAQMTCDTRLITCECCQRNFIEGLITGDGSKISYEQYVAQKQEHTFPTLREKAEAAEAAERAATEGVWATSKPASDPYLDGIAKRWPGSDPLAAERKGAADGWTTGGTQTGRWTSDTSHIEEVPKAPGDGWTTGR